MLPSATVGSPRLRQNAGALKGLLLLGAGVVLCLAATPTFPSAAAEHATVMVVVGAPGEAEYGQGFAQWAGMLEKAARQAAAKDIIIGLKTNAAPIRDQLQQALADEPKEGAAEFW